MCCLQLNMFCLQLNMCCRQLVYLGSTGTNGVDFELAYRQRVHWDPHGSLVQSVNLRISNNHEHVPNDEVYIGLINARGAVLPAHAAVIKVVIVNDVTLPPVNLTASRLSKLVDMPWVAEITDVYVRNRFLDAWQLLPTRPYQQLTDENKPDKLVMVVSEGRYRYESQKVHKVMLSRADRGAILGLLSAHYKRPSPIRTISKGHGRVWAMPVEALARHNVSARQNLYDIMQRHIFRMLVVNNRHKYPVLLFPGFMSSRLQAWNRKACNGLGVRPMELVWLSLEKLMQAVVMDAPCWLQCLSLGPHQSDSDCKLRPAQGIGAVSELSSELASITTIFRTLIEFLVDKWGYDSSTMLGMPVSGGSYIRGCDGHTSPNGFQRLLSMTVETSAFAATNFRFAYLV
eukprot:TRINITY_DN11801_c0_g1_i14.p1 TRINITY_DN11801_c0_g1~~TRINITY_DN11801_c0_g1_i14.p1  ORF type:complete len:401 (+),score=55.82 TRINITY_DN11801_c0_g1_i14:93-1295(+)